MAYVRGVSTASELGALLEHVDRALHLCAEASGELGSAGSAAASEFSPFGGIKKLLGQWRARRLLGKARPHLDAIFKARSEAKTWLANPPKEIGSAGWMTADIASELAGNLGDAIIDSFVHDRIEGQLLELNAFLHELGLLHLKLRTAKAALA